MAAIFDTKYHVYSVSLWSKSYKNLDWKNFHLMEGCLRDSTWL